jgi:GTP-binding protein HflX
LGKTYGNLRGLNKREEKNVEKVADQRLKIDQAVTQRIARRMARVSADIGRVLGILVDRQGRIQSVTVGDNRRLYLPDIGRQRGGRGRFRGIRLIRTDFDGAELQQDDLMDLSKLQLDAVITVGVDDDGNPGEVEWAHLIPDNPEQKMWEIKRVSHPNAFPEDFSQFILEVEAEFEDTVQESAKVSEDVAMLVYVKTLGDWEADARMNEMLELCRTAGVHVVESYQQSRKQLDPKYGVGQGALEELELRCLQLGADILIFGQDLEPAQMRNITKETNLRVIDRTQLILDIFAQRAQSSVGKFQVELAQLKYTLPRLTGRGEAMSRLAGGIGGRGPGETKLEVDRRRARDRIRNLEERIEKLREQRDLRRKNRREREVPVVSIVGYTNAGKSTLLNRLTHSGVLSEDKLFATLDPTTRRIRFPQEREVVMTDTVGFIRDLPSELREAFRATLEELEEADVMFHVVDVTDPSFDSHIKSTERILRELGVEETPRILVLNKCDLIDDDDERWLEIRSYDGVEVSAVTEEGLDTLIDELDRTMVNFGIYEPDAAQ